MSAGLPNNGNILVIEDDPIMLKAISNILNKGGYNVITACDAKEAFELLELEHYDIVITDIMLPYGSGLEVVRRIRKIDSRNNVGIIIVTSMWQEEKAREAYGYGVDVYLKKPITAAELLSRMTILLKDKREISASVLVKVPAHAAHSDTFPRNSGTDIHIRRYRVPREF